MVVMCKKGTKLNGSKISDKNNRVLSCAIKNHCLRPGSYIGNFVCVVVLVALIQVLFNSMLTLCGFMLTFFALCLFIADKKYCKQGYRTTVIKSRQNIRKLISLEHEGIQEWTDECNFAHS
jgi:hypothetical protein